jgi:hypothetical protein
LHPKDTVPPLHWLSCRDCSRRAGFASFVLAPAAGRAPTAGAGGRMVGNVAAAALQPSPAHATVELFPLKLGQSHKTCHKRPRSDHPKSCRTCPIARLALCPLHSRCPVLSAWLGRHLESRDGRPAPCPLISAGRGHGSAPGAPKWRGEALECNGRGEVPSGRHCARRGASGGRARRGRAPLKETLSQKMSNGPSTWPSAERSRLTQPRPGDASPNSMSLPVAGVF